MSAIKIAEDSGIKIEDESDIIIEDDPTSSKSRWGWLEKFSNRVFRKSSAKNSTGKQAVTTLEGSIPKSPIIFSPNETEVPNQNLKEPVEIIEESLDRVTGQDVDQETEATLQPEARKKVLRPANKIFFHATPSQNIDDIRQTGLIARKDQDVIGRILGYSLTFSSEFNLPEGRRITVVLGDDPVKDFSLTIWKNSAEIKKIKDKDGKIRMDQYGLAKKLGSTELIPQSYLDSRGGGSWGRTVNPEMMRKIDPANFLAAISIDQNVQETLIRCKIEFAYNLGDANTIEERLVGFLNGPDRNLQLSQDYTTQDLAHDLMARIQQEVLADKTRIVAEDLLNHIENPGPSDRYNSDLIAAEAEEISTKTLEVNEPISNRYLKAWEKKLKLTCEKKGIAWPIHTDIEAARRQSILKLRLSTIDTYQFWGDNDSYKLARQVAAKMGITL